MIKTVEKAMEKIEDTIEELLELRESLVMLKYRLSTQTARKDA